MNRTDLRNALVDNMDREGVKLSKKDAKLVLDLLFGSTEHHGIIPTAMKRGDKIGITGFGTFEKKHMKARMARNPQTGESIKVPAKNKCAFRFGKVVKDYVL